MKVSITSLFMAIFGVALLLGVLAQPLVDAASNNGLDGDSVSSSDDDHEASTYEKLVASLKIIDALVLNELKELELAQQHESQDKNSRGFVDDFLNRKSRFLNKRMKSVALGFGK